MNRTIFAVLAMLAHAAAQAEAAPPQPPRQPNGLALTPPMGWISHHAACKVDERTIRAAADQLVASGMREAGYRYVVLDDCWQGARRADGQLDADAKRFPSGLKTLADYVHAQGLLFGLTTGAGKQSCAGGPGGRGHEYQDARQFTAWGVDYLRANWCHTDSQNAKSTYETINDSARNIVLAIADDGKNQAWLWGLNIANSWSGGDASFAGPGHWNDPGLLDNPGRAQFSKWALQAAPLMVTGPSFTNGEVIAVDQDRLGVQGTRLSGGETEVWFKPLSGGARAVGFFNNSKQSRTMQVEAETLGLPATLRLAVRDLWQGRDLAPASGTIAVEVPAQGVVMLKLEGQQ